MRALCRKIELDANTGYVKTYPQPGFTGRAGRQPHQVTSVTGGMMINIAERLTRRILKAQWDRVKQEVAHPDDLLGHNPEAAKAPGKAQHADDIGANPQDQHRILSPRRR